MNSMFLLYVFVFFFSVDATNILGSVLDTLKGESCDYLTTNHGQKIVDNQNSLKLGERGPTLMEDHIFREKMTHFDHERIPERVVHARGSAAHGYFQVYESMAKYTKAAFLQDPSAKTPVFVRFSTVVGPRGSPDLTRDVRGFATKFYTQEGNFDLVGNNIPVFFVQDAIKFPDLVHAAKGEPHNEIPTGQTAHNNFWDFISLTPESMHMIMWVLSDRALPRSFSQMEGFGVHTFRLVNADGKSVFVKFHWKPLNGVYSLLFDEAQIINGKDPDFHRRDLWDLIELGNYPEYELGIQILEESEVNRVEFDILDSTKIWPEEIVPVKRIGKMTLNRNPTNFFNEVEQVAFHMGNLVSGIDVTDDPLLQGRLFSYLDTQLIRLGGPNFHEIPINNPVVPVANHQFEGYKRHSKDQGRVNYEPNSLGHGCPWQASRSHGWVSYPERVTGEKLRKRSESFGDHYTQATLFWNSMSDYEKRHIIMAFQVELGKVQYPHIQEKMVDHLNHINHSLAVVVAKSLGLSPPTVDKSKAYKKTSPALSQQNLQASTLVGRKVAILGAGGPSCLAVANDLITMLKASYIVPIVISNTLGDLSGDGETLHVNQTYRFTASVLFDAVLIVGIEEEAIMDAMWFVQEAYKHLKPIGAIGDGAQIVELAGIKDPVHTESAMSTNAGVILAGPGVSVDTFWGQFKNAMMRHRFWDRELKLVALPKVSKAE